jgi:hypothetical protein
VSEPPAGPPPKEPETGFGAILLYVAEFLAVLGILAYGVAWLWRRL